MTRILLSKIHLFLAVLLLSGCIHSAVADQIKETAAVPPPSSELTIERLFGSPSLSGPSARLVRFSPDGKRVTFLKPRDADQARFDLWQFDIETGKQTLLIDSELLDPEQVELSEEEKALRERKRITGQRGIVDYDWGTAETILVPSGGDLHLIRLEHDGPTAIRLTETDAFEYDAKISPAGNYASFVRDGAMYAIDLDTKEETRLTPLAEPDRAVSYGVSEFVAQEEMDRYTGYWWSPDDRYLAYTRVDESTVDIIPRFDIAAEEVTVVNQRYPRAGRPNAIVDLFIRDMKTGGIVQIDWRQDEWGPATDQYLARVNWTQDRLHVKSVNRDQTVIHWQSYKSGEWDQQRDEFIERQKSWVNLSNDFYVTDEHILFTSEAEGFRHIAAQSRHGADVFAITQGDWVVSRIEGVDLENNWIFFTGYVDTPLEKHLYRTPIAPARFDATPEAAKVTYVDAPPPIRITEAGKSWSISMTSNGKHFVGTSSAPDQPPQTGLYKNDGTRMAWIEENALDEGHPYAPFLGGHTVPDYGTIAAEDGQDLYYSIQLPPDFDPEKTYPAIVEVYGGPHAQTVTRNWERLTDQFYTREGYIVFRLDNRGMYNRGKAFEDVIHLRTGGPEVRDQLRGVEWLKAQPYVDPHRVAIQGWSYGGYMTLMTLLQAPEGTFAAAVAGAPVTDWRLYDTFYTERYMGTPENNSDGYEASSVFPFIDNLNTPLLLVHGMADDNVTFDNTTRLMAELQQRGKQFDLMTYPGQRHGIRGEDLQIHLMRTRMAFLERHLKTDSE